MVSDRAVSRNDYFTPPQIMILMTGSYIMAIACESVVVYYIAKWNTFRQRRRVRQGGWLGWRGGSELAPHEHTVLLWTSRCKLGMQPTWAELCSCHQHTKIRILQPQLTHSNVC